MANARVFAGQGLSAQDTIACFEQINTSLARLAGMSDEATGRRTLSLATLTELGLHPEAAARLCAVCESEDALLDGEVQSLAERAKISPLMLAMIREELKARRTVREAEASATEQAEGERTPPRRPKLVPIRASKKPASGAGDEEHGQGGDA